MNDRGDVRLPPEVRSDYSNARELDRSRLVNIGDFLVCDATLKLLNVPFSRSIEIMYDRSQFPDVSQLREEFSYLVIRGANYLSESHDLGVFAEFLENLDLPIVIFGLGAQSPDYRDLTFLPGTKRFLEVVAERAVSIGVRGNFTAEQASRHGVANLSVLGCPSFIRRGKSRIKIEKRGGFRSIGVTLNRYATGEYAVNDLLVRRLQAHLLRAAASRIDSVLIAQGEKEESILALGLDRDAAALHGIMSHLDLGSGELGVSQMLTSRSRVFFDLTEWADFTAKLDFLVGFRLHGNLVGLHQGVPAVLITHDSRTQEIVDLFALPHLKTTEYPNIDLDWIYEEADFDAFEGTYPRIYSDWIQFLDGAGVSHNLSMTGDTDSEQVQSRARAIDVMRIPGQQNWYQQQLLAFAREVEVLRAMKSSTSR